MTRLELLAPARDLECGIAAIDHGADAVYIGAPAFGARAEAGNSVEDIRTLCDYAHRFLAKVYVTVNTIVYENELDDVEHLVRQLGEAGVDAILVQDMAVLEMVQRVAAEQQRPIEVHASTQADNRTPERVGWLFQEGCSRVVLARELTLDQMQAIHEAVPGVELEAFVHGALCVSYSGLRTVLPLEFRPGGCRRTACRPTATLALVEGHVPHRLSRTDGRRRRHLV